MKKKSTPVHGDGPIKVAIIPHPQNVFPPQGGSVAKVAWESARRLAAHCEVTIFARRDPDQEKFSCVDGVNIRRVKTTVDEKVVWRIVDRLQRYWGLEKYALFRFYLYLGFIVKTALLIRRQGFQIVHIHNYAQFAPVIRFFNAQCKIVLHMHCHWLVEMDFKMVRQRLAAVDLILSPSASITEQTRRRFSLPAARCVTVPNGVDTHCFSKREESLLQATRRHYGLHGKDLVLFVGRLTPEKGVHVLLEAMATVVKVFPDVVLVVAGADFLTPISARTKTDGLYQQMENMKSNYRGCLNELIERHGLEVVFTGYKPHQELVNFYSLATVVVLPSFEEAGPLPVLEAMSCQAPMVATAVDGIKDYLSPQAGFLVPPNDATALAKKIMTCLDNRKLCETMGRCGRRWVEAQFTWDHVAENLLSAYSGLVQKRSTKEGAYDMEAAAPFHWRTVAKGEPGHCPSAHPMPFS